MNWSPSRDPGEDVFTGWDIVLILLLYVGLPLLVLITLIVGVVMFVRPRPALMLTGPDPEGSLIREMIARGVRSCS